MNPQKFTIQKPSVSVSQTLLNNRKFVITKKIAKHGKQAVIISLKYRNS